MRMFIQHVGWSRTRTQHEVFVQRFEVHEGIVLALHRPLGKYDCWVVSDYLTGGMIATSVSDKVAFAIAKWKLTKHLDRYKETQIHALTQLKLRCYDGGENYKLKKRLQRKCEERDLNYYLARTANDVETVDILGAENGEITFKLEVQA